MSADFDSVLQGIVNFVQSNHQTSSSATNNVKGSSREDFIRNYLEKILPVIYRFGTGEVIDREGNSSGQVDIVIENIISPSFPLNPITGTPRLYVAESVGAIIEVKSDIRSQWQQVTEKIDKVSKIDRKLYDSVQIKYYPPPFWQQHPDKVPFYVVGFKGPKNIQDGYNLLKKEQFLAGILSIDPLFVCSRNSFFADYPVYGVSGPRALWAFAAELQFVLRGSLLAIPQFVAYLSNEIYVTDAFTGQFVKANLVK